VGQFGYLLLRPRARVPVAPHLSETVSEDSVGATSAASAGPGGGASATSEDSSLRRDVDPSAAGGAAGAPLEWVSAGAGASAGTPLEWVGTGGASAGAPLEWVGAAGTGANASASGASATSAPVEPVVVSGLVPESGAGLFASMTSSVGAALTFRGRGGQLVACGAKAIRGGCGLVVAVWVVATSVVVGVGTEWVPASGESSFGSGSFSGGVVAGVSTILAYAVVVAGVTLVATVNIGVSSKAAESRARPPSSCGASADLASISGLAILASVLCTSQL
jgi:hypothetical protein